MRRESEPDQPTSIFETKSFQKRTTLEKQTAKEAIDWGFIVQNQFINLDQWAKYFYLWSISVHEIGHATMVKATGNSLRKVTNIAHGNTLGATYFDMDTTVGEEQYNNNVIDIGLGGGIAAEVVGLHPEGTSYDDGIVDLAAERQRRRNRDSRGGVKSRGRQRVIDRLASDITGLKYGAHKLNRDRVA